VPGASSPSTPPSPEATTHIDAIECRLASSEDELEAHFELRRAVFVHEQRLFELDDHDARDEARVTLHALGLIDGEPCGAVRLYPLERSWRRWKGDRLAVLPELRTHHLGADLVRFAVSTAGQLGGSRMVAHVQLPNVRFFEHLGWRREGSAAPFHGIDHQLMSIGLGPGA
jgi:putative N-acetyltransferase (TIGR04045 family)